MAIQINASTGQATTVARTGPESAPPADMGVALIKLAEYIVVAPDNWVASTAYSLGDEISPTTPDGNKYVCSTAGTSGETEPTWDTDLGDTTNDNTAVWTAELAGESEIEFTNLSIVDHELHMVRLLIHNNYTTSEDGDSNINLFVNEDETASNYKYRSGNVNGSQPYIAHSSYGEQTLMIAYVRRTLDDNCVAVSSQQNYACECPQIGWWHEQGTDTDLNEIKLSVANGKNVFGINTSATVYGYR